MPSTTRRSAGRQVVIEVIAVIVALAVGASFSAVIIGMEVNEARVNATSAKANADSGNLSGLITSVEGLQGNVEALSAYTKSPAWLITQYIPAIGDPVRAASTLTTGANNVAQAAASTAYNSARLYDASTEDGVNAGNAALTQAGTILTGTNVTVQRGAETVTVTVTGTAATLLPGLPATVTRTVTGPTERWVP